MSSLALDIDAQGQPTRFWEIQRRATSRARKSSSIWLTFETEVGPETVAVHVFRSRIAGEPSYAAYSAFRIRPYTGDEVHPPRRNPAHPPAVLGVF
jgi:hypothetical protein